MLCVAILRVVFPADERLRFYVEVVNGSKQRCHDNEDRTLIVECMMRSLLHDANSAIIVVLGSYNT
jgi:hypothetical protein